MSYAIHKDGRRLMRTYANELDAWKAAASCGFIGKVGPGAFVRLKDEYEIRRDDMVYAVTYSLFGHEIAPYLRQHEAHVAVLSDAAKSDPEIEAEPDLVSDPSPLPVLPARQPIAMCGHCSKEVFEGDTIERCAGKMLYTAAPNECPLHDEDWEDDVGFRYLNEFSSIDHDAIKKLTEDFVKYTQEFIDSNPVDRANILNADAEMNQPAGSIMDLPDGYNEGKFEYPSDQKYSESDAKLFAANRKILRLRETLTCFVEAYRRVAERGTEGLSERHNVVILAQNLRLGDIWNAREILKEIYPE